MWVINYDDDAPFVCWWTLGGNCNLYPSQFFSEWLINSILWHFKINADISILEKSVILGLRFCVFAGYSVLTSTNELSDLLANK